MPDFMEGTSVDISIHALREEGDLVTETNKIMADDFYPRPPRGGRPGRLQNPERLVDFYPRPPRGGRRRGPLSGREKCNFYPRPPRGGRLYPYRRCHPDNDISIHALREEGDKLAMGAADVSDKFLSTPSARRATACARPKLGTFSISIHALREEGDDTA